MFRSLNKTENTLEKLATKKRVEKEDINSVGTVSSYTIIKRSFPALPQLLVRSFFMDLWNIDLKKEEIL